MHVKKCKSLIILNLRKPRKEQQNIQNQVISGIPVTRIRPSLEIIIPVRTIINKKRSKRHLDKENKESQENTKDPSL